MFSLTVDYAIRAVVYLSRLHSEATATTEEISAAHRIPPGYHSKILRELAGAGLVSSKRGRRGGFCLSRSGELITLLDVTRAVDPVRRLDRCPMGLPAQQSEACVIRRRLNSAIDHVETAMAGISVADIARSVDHMNALASGQVAEEFPAGVPLAIL